MKFSPLRNRIREYEDAYRIKLPKRTPIIIRVDGKAFHTITRNFKHPWDVHFVSAMNKAALALCKEIQGAQLAYVQSDEISVFVRNYDKYETSPWFDNNLQKICSVSAGIATRAFNSQIENLYKLQGSPRVQGLFDSRVFCVPREEVCNVFVDRQIDCIRNSKLALGQHIIGKKAIHGMDQDTITETLKEKHSTDWNDQHNWKKFGRMVYKVKEVTDCSITSVSHIETGLSMQGRVNTVRTKWRVIDETPLFQESRYLVDDLVWPKDEEGNYSTYK